MTKLVISRPLAGIGEDFIRLLGFLELFFSLLIAGITVGVILHRQPAVSLFDFGFAGVGGHFKNFVIIAFRHRSVVR